MGLFNSLLKTAIDTVKLPVSATQDIIDVVTGDIKESKTEDNISDIVTDIGDVFDKLI